LQPAWTPSVEFRFLHGASGPFHSVSRFEFKMAETADSIETPSFPIDVWAIVRVFLKSGAVDVHVTADKIAALFCWEESPSISQVVPQDIVDTYGHTESHNPDRFERITMIPVPSWAFRRFCSIAIVRDTKHSHLPNYKIINWRCV
jgi:hypothetical protein